MAKTKTSQTVEKQDTGKRYHCACGTWIPIYRVRKGYMAYCPHCLYRTFISDLDLFMRYRQGAEPKVEEKKEVDKKYTKED